MQQLTDSQRFPGIECRLRFGRTLTAWLNRGGWVHDTPQRWGKAAGFPTPKNATFSQLQRGIVEQPKPLTFYQLGLMNDRLHRKDWGVIADIRLRQRVQAQEPICTPEGRPWTSADFFGHFMGIVDPPDWVHSVSVVTEEDAKRITGEMIQQFQQVAQKRLLNPVDAWQQLLIHCTHLTKAQQDTFRSVLSGWHVWTPDELMEMGNGEPGSKLLRALNSWSMSPGE